MCTISDKEQMGTVEVAATSIDFYRIDDVLNPEEVLDILWVLLES